MLLVPFPAYRFQLPRFVSALWGFNGFFLFVIYSPLYCFGGVIVCDGWFSFCIYFWKKKKIIDGGLAPTEKEPPPQ